MTMERLSVHKDVKETLFTNEQIQGRVEQLGARIAEDYADRGPLVVVSILKGGAMFMADLVRAIDLDLEMDYLAVSSYGMEARSSGVVDVVKDLSLSIEGKNVLIAEDVLDSGLTLDHLVKMLSARGPASLEIAALLVKTGAQKVDVRCKYVGFDCPDEFIVGYGLDYAERYRNLPYIGVLKPEVYL